MWALIRRSGAIVVVVLVALVPAAVQSQRDDPTERSSEQPEDGGSAERLPSPLRLVDIGPALGFSQNTHSWDLVVGRVDGDPIPDLVVADHDRIRVWLNREPGLELSLIRKVPDPHGCALADVTGNGLGDLYCTAGAKSGAATGPNRLYLQEPEGTWTERSAAYGVVDPYGRGRRTTFFDLDGRHGPDLFVGNEPGRSGRGVSLNRTFVQRPDGPMERRALGPIGDKGAVCVQAVDYDLDGRQDLLVCGGHSQARGRPGRLHLFRNVPAPGGGRRLVDVALRLGIVEGGVRSAHLARLNGDRFPDLVVVSSKRLVVRPGNRHGGFDPPAYSRRLVAGAWVAVGDVDGRRGNDLFVVQSCTRAGNARDILLLHAGGLVYEPVRAPDVGRGCGDTAAMIDLDGDGRDEIVVGNGRWANRGPMQVLTLGRWRGEVPAG